MLISLTVGILFNYGIVGITLGEINMLTSILGALLVGMGIDYGIQIVTSYSGFLAAGEAPDEALRTTFSRSGSGVLLAALTTAVAFFVFMVSTSTALRQFGLVAGTGIITCFLAMILFLPSLLLWFGKKGGSAKTGTPHRLPQINYAFLTTLGLKSSRRKWIVIPTAAVLVIGAGIFAVRTITLEYDMIKLQPQNVPSTIASGKMLERFGRSSSSASIGLDNIEEAQTLTEELETLRDVLAVLSVSQYIPSGDKQDERLAVIRSLREPNTIPLAWDETDLEALQEAVQELEWNIIEIGDLSVAGLGDDNRIVRERNRRIREIFGAEVGDVDAGNTGRGD
jgi:predicted RND superfamily exporter protein